MKIVDENKDRFEYPGNDLDEALQWWANVALDPVRIAARENSLCVYATLHHGVVYRIAIPPQPYTPGSIPNYRIVSVAVPDPADVAEPEPADVAVPKAQRVDGYLWRGKQYRSMREIDMQNQRDLLMPLLSGSGRHTDDWICDWILGHRKQLMDILSATVMVENDEGENESK